MHFAFVAGFEEIEDIWFIIKQLDTQISLFKEKVNRCALFKSKRFG
jgi:hypothetical protein